MQTILKVKDVTKNYNKNQKPSLQKVSFNVKAGEFIGIMGASGSGKTTLLNVLSTIDKPTSGLMQNILGNSLSQYVPVVIAIVLTIIIYSIYYFLTVRACHKIITR